MQWNLLPASLLLVFLPFGKTAYSQQIQNPSFEVLEATTPPLPEQWNVRQAQQGSGALSQQVAHTGHCSLQLSSTGERHLYAPSFSQTSRVQVGQLTALHLKAAVKVTPGAHPALWCQLRSETKLLRAVSTHQWEGAPTGTGQWQELELVVLVTPQVRHLVFGGELTGQGQAWFDDLRWETIPAAAPTAPAVRAYVDSALAKVRRYALVRDSIDWPSTRAAVYTLTMGLQTAAQAYPAVTYLLEVLRGYGDTHTRFLTAAAVRDKEAATPAQADLQGEARYLGAGLGYVKVPAFSGMNPARTKAFATHLQAQIRAVDTQQPVSGWVVDLRENRGGNLYPMLAGLGPLLEEDTLGYFISSNRQTPWVYAHGNAYSDLPSYGMQVTNPYTLRHPKAPVAVLIGPQTGSSGEMTAISFRGRPHTRFFGQPTAGLTTGNMGYDLPDGSRLYLAVAVAADRRRQKQVPRLEPDEKLFKGSDGNDAVLTAAKSWLLQQSKQ